MLLNSISYYTKFPIIIEESRKIIFFPTTSIRTQQSSWIALNHIKDIKLEDNKTINSDNKVSVDDLISEIDLSREIY